MATSSRRDVKLVVETETTGEEGLRRLANEVRALAKAGGDMAPEFAAAAAQLDKLAGQDAAIGSLKALNAAVTDLATRQEAAAAASLALSQDLALQRENVDNLRAAQVGAVAAVRDQAEALAFQRKALADLKANLDGVDKSTEAYAAQLRNARAAVADAATELRTKRSALADLNGALSQAVTAERSLGDAYRQAASQADASTQALRAQRNALADASDSARALGVEVTDLAAAERNLRAAQEATVASVRQIAAAQAELVDLDRASASAKQELAARNKAAAEAYEQEMAQLNAEIQQQAAATERANAEALKYVETLEAEAAAADKAARRVAELNATAAKTARDAQYVREVAAAFDAVERQAQEAAAEVQRVQGYFAGLKAEADKVNQAFGQTGVRSFDAIRREMLGVTQATATLRAQFAAGEISAADLGRAVSSAQVRLATLKREMETIPALPGVFERLSSSIGGLINRFGALGAAVATIGVAVKPVLDATIALDQMRRVLTQVTGSAAEAGRQIEFVRDTARRAGQSVTDVGQSYSKFAASALQAGLSQKQVADAFAAVSLAAGNLGLSTEQSKRALEALSQMASKGAIGMEELRQQLGDALPGVLPLLARELGLTTQQLNKVVESGGLLANEGIPAISRALKALGPASGEVDGLVASWNRFKNVLSETSTVLADGAFGRAAGAALVALGAVVERVAFGVAYLGESFTVVGKQIGTVVAAIVTRDFKTLSDALGQIEKESTEKLAALANRLSDAGAAAGAAAPAVEAVATASHEAAAGHEAAAVAAEKQTAALAGGVAPAQAAATAQDRLATSAGKVTAAVSSQAGAVTSGARSFAQLSLATGDQIKASELAAQNAEKHTQAVKDGSAALVKSAEIAGSDVGVKQAQAQASADVAQAALEQARADQAVVTTLQAARTAQVEYATASGMSATAIAEFTKKLDEKISKATADAEKSQQAARLAEDEAASRRVLSETYKDNSANLELFRKTVAETAAEVTRVSARYAEGKATLDQLQAATRAAAGAQALFRDALSDTEKVARARIQTLETDTRVMRAKVSSEIAFHQAAKITAESVGDTNAALEASIRIKELERQQIVTSVTAKQTEAKIEMDAAQRARDEAIRMGEFQGEKQLEIESRINNARAKLAEAAAGKDAIAVIEAEIDALKRRQRQQAQGGGSSGSAPKKKEWWQEKGLDADPSKGSAHDKEGFSVDTSGNRVTSGTYLPPPDNSGDWAWVPKLNQGYTFGGYWEKQNPGNATQFGSTTQYTGMGGAKTDVRGSHVGAGTVFDSGAAAYVPPKTSGAWGGVPDDAARTGAYDLLGITPPSQAADDAKAAKQAFDLIAADPRATLSTKREAFLQYAELAIAASGRVTSELESQATRLGLSLDRQSRDAKFNTEGGLTRNTVGAGDPGPSGGSSSHTVTINLGGRATTVNLASAGDASSLTDLLKQLETAAGRGG